MNGKMGGLELKKLFGRPRELNLLYRRSGPQQLFCHGPPSFENVDDDPLRALHTLNLGESDVLNLGQGASRISYVVYLAAAKVSLFQIPE